MKQSTNTVLITGLAFPYNEHGPAHLFKRCYSGKIPAPGAFELRQPIFRPRPWNICQAAPWMLVPEAAVNKHSGTIAWKHNVR